MWVKDKNSHRKWRAEKCEMVANFGVIQLWQEIKPNTFDGGRRVFVARGADSYMSQFKTIEEATVFVESL